MTYGLMRANGAAEQMELRAGATRFVWHTPQGAVQLMESPLTGRGECGATGKAAA